VIRSAAPRERLLLDGVILVASQAVPFIVRALQRLVERRGSREGAIKWS
jgi:hypothetical protein